MKKYLTCFLRLASAFLIVHFAGGCSSWGNLNGVTSGGAGTSMILRPGARLGGSAVAGAAQLLPSKERMSLPGSPPPAPASIQVAQSNSAKPLETFRENLLLLDFDLQGELVNAEDLERLLREKKRFKSIIVLSYGWNNTREEAYSDYSNFCREYEEGHTISSDALIVGVSWDSKMQTLHRMASDIYPAKLKPDPFALLDTASMPLSFWAKAALADKIGLNLQPILQSVSVKFSKPDFYFVGHSFGCRVVSRALQTDRVGKSVFLPGDRSQVKGAVLIQGALTLRDCPHPKYDRLSKAPIIIVSSEHDIANRLLYPLANTFINTYAVRVANDWVENLVEETVLFKGSFTSIATTWKNCNEASFRLVNSGAQIVWVPVVSILWSAGGYLTAQISELRHRHIFYPLDSLASVPIMGQFIEDLTPENWEVGKHHLGLFQVGGIQNAVGASGPNYFGGPFSSKSVRYDVTPKIHPGKRTFYDASKAIRTSMFGKVDMESGLLRALPFPVGAHNDYRNPEVYELVSGVIK